MGSGRPLVVSSSTLIDHSQIDDRDIEESIRECGVFVTNAGDGEYATELTRMRGGFKPQASLCSLISPLTCRNKRNFCGTFGTLVGLTPYY
jgi:hypothetical protein